MTQTDRWPYRPVPNPADPLYADYLEGLRKRMVVVRKCSSCGLVQWPPRPLCTNCRGLEFERQAINGEGVIYTYTIVYRAFDRYFKSAVPYGVAVVDLDAGIRMLGGWAGETLDGIACGVRVKAHFVDSGDDGTYLYWSPSLESAHQAS